MANKDAAFGFRALNIDGSPYSGSTYRVRTLSTATAAIFVGDPVKLATTGVNTGGYMDVQQGTAGAAVLGVVASVEANPDNLSQQYRLAATERFLNIVLVDGSKTFEVQADDTGTALALASIGLNANFVVAGGSTVTGMSGVELNSDTVATTTGFDCQILGFTRDPDNLHSGTGSAPKRVIVKFNNGQLRAGRTGVS
ncbi:MAG: hypothetical protein ACYSW3_27245 [Planctomycetota bacterium]|jgi:hypothetical protein